ncbi:hypothetical protein RRG08_035208 [Elysia crispata]|uniref:Uncharacterized protein n=1 Tax=Elysia crispata TaxID=231223 RepID=A0AAE0ZPF0_9GAST|nr:hypothetical protein RRG08_035208 [Elysia crispata]
MTQGCMYISCVVASDERRYGTLTSSLQNVCQLGRTLVAFKGRTVARLERMHYGVARFTPKTAVCFTLKNESEPNLSICVSNLAVHLPLVVTVVIFGEKFISGFSVKIVRKVYSDRSFG